MIALLLLLAQEPDVERWIKDPKTAAGLSPGAVEAELRKPPRRAAVDVRGQVVRVPLVADHPLKVPFEYALWIPADYTPEKAWRMIVTLHGQNGNGPDMTRVWLADLQRDGQTFLLCPSAGRGGWGRSRLGHAYVLGAIRDVLGKYAVDPDRIYLDGASMGGNGSFEFVCLFPDLFAAAAPRSGGPFFRYLPAAPGQAEREVVAEGLENLAATPIYWVIGGKDPKVPYAWVKTARAQMEALKLDLTYREHPDGGHEWFPGENAAVLAWMASKVRSAYPPKVAVATTDRLFRRNFWLEIAEFKGKENVRRNFGDLQGKSIEERLVFQEEAVVTGELLRESNEIKIAAAGAREVKVYLHERMLDYGKPVGITVNGRRTSHTVRPSVDVLLESARRDRGLLYTASVKVTAP
jgi:dienelactone hydrolase